MTTQTIPVEQVSCLAHIRENHTYFGGKQYEIISLEDIRKETIRCKNTETEYIKTFIRILKEKIIRKLPRLDKTEIKLELLDNNSVLHLCYVTAYDMLLEKSRIQRKVNHNKSIFVTVYYENIIVFIGNLNFG